MAVHPNSPEKGTNRKRKTHTKSRAGCRNCKIRRVKCDEGRPTCQKCKSYVVACSYDTGESTDDLLSSMTGAFSIKGADKIKAPSPTDLAIYNTVMSPSPLLIAKFPKTELIRQLPREDIEILGKFQNRTITTLGTTSTMGVYQREMMRLASDSPYLLHIVLTLTLMHDRYLRDGNVIEQSTAEAYHWYKGTALFNQVLRGPVKPEEKDTLWATAALLGAIAFACVDARTPEQAWPLRPATGTDLEWLRMSDGKKSVMKIADPYRPDSAFAEVAPLHRKDFASLSSTDCRIKALPDGFVKLFDLGPGSARQNNPYHSPAAVLSQLLEIECTQQTILKYLAFISFVEPEYKILLERKDSRALLLLSYWFAKICPYNQWWMQRRALLECQSICIFLQRYHWYDIEIQRLLHYPRMMCGLSPIITNKAFEA